MNVEKGWRRKVWANASKSKCGEGDVPNFFTCEVSLDVIILPLYSINLFNVIFWFRNRKVDNAKFLHSNGCKSSFYVKYISEKGECVKKWDLWFNVKNNVLYEIVATLPRSPTTKFRYSIFHQLLTNQYNGCVQHHNSRQTTLDFSNFGAIFALPFIFPERFWSSTRTAVPCSCVITPLSVGLAPVRDP